RRNVRRVLERYQRAGDPAPGLRRGDRARRADGQRERIPRLTLEVLVKQGLARVVRGEGIVGRGAEPGPQRDQAGQPRDPCEQGEPPVAVAGAAERAQHARSGARAASARGTGEGTRGVRHIKLLRAGGVLALRYSPPAARGKSRAGRHFGRPGTPPEYSPGSTADLAAGRRHGGPPASSRRSASRGGLPEDFGGPLVGGIACQPAGPPQVPAE